MATENFANFRNSGHKKSSNFTTSQCLFCRNYIYFFFGFLCYFMAEMFLCEFLYTRLLKIQSLYSLFAFITRKFKPKKNRYEFFRVEKSDDDERERERERNKPTTTNQTNEHARRNTENSTKFTTTKYSSLFLASIQCSSVTAFLSLFASTHSHT